MHRRSLPVLLLAGLLLALLLAVPSARQAGPTGGGAPSPPLRVQLGWLPQAQFAGFFVAQERRYFEREGLRVRLQAGGAGIVPLQQLLKGNTDVAIGWSSDALMLRSQGADLVNIAQMLPTPGMMLLCREEAGVRSAADLRGKRIGSWFLGDQFNLTSLLRRVGLPATAVQLVPQRPDGVDLLEGRVDCATAMSYNEFLTILNAKGVDSDLFKLRFTEEDAGFLEDGLYVRGEDLRDPRRRRDLVKLLRGLAAGWEHTRRYPQESVVISRRFMAGGDPSHQRQMLEEILSLSPPNQRFGLLDQEAFARSVAIVARGSDDPEGIARAARGAWTLKVWRAAGLGGPQRGPLGPAGRHVFGQLVSGRWFYALNLLGTVAFAISGFLRAEQRRYDLWGCFILTLLPAVGGGTLRDLLIGGSRSPLFLFQDSTYLAVVVAVLVVGCIGTQCLPSALPDKPWFQSLLDITDTLGLATFTIIGSRVALEADLAWWWIPICAALTCAGGGMLLDIVTGREPRTFQGEPYEEIAILGSLVLLAGLLVADAFETLSWPVLAAMVVSWWVVFLVRMVVIRRGLRSWRPGREPRPQG